MRVEAGGLIYDDDDERCTITIVSSAKNNELVYILCVTCFDAITQRIKFYHSVTDKHLYDYDDEEKRRHIKDTIRLGGDAYQLFAELKSTTDYTETLYEK